MHLHFTIRDLLWLTTVVALALAWWLDHSDLKWTAAKDRDFEARCKARVDNVVELLEANKATTELERRRVDQLWRYIRYIHDKNPDLQMGIPDLSKPDSIDAVIDYIETTMHQLPRPPRPTNTPRSARLFRLIDESYHFAHFRGPGEPATLLMQFRFAQ